MQSVHKVRTHFTTRYEDKIMEIIKASAASSVTVSFVSHHDTFLEKVERGLGVWLEDVAQNGFSVSVVVRGLPCSYTATTQSVGKEKGSFKASKGWFRSFKYVVSLNSMKTVESASADHVAAGKYIECLKEN